MRKLNSLFLKFKPVIGFSFILGILFVLFFPIPFYKNFIFNKKLIYFIVYLPVLFFFICLIRSLSTHTVVIGFLFFIFYSLWGFFFYFEFFFQTRISFSLILYGLETYSFLKSDILEFLRSIPYGTLLHGSLFPIVSIFLEIFSNKKEIFKKGKIPIALASFFLIFYLSNSLSESSRMINSISNSTITLDSLDQGIRSTKNDAISIRRLPNETDVLIFLLEGVGFKYWNTELALRPTNLHNRNSIGLTNRISIDNCYITTPHSSKSIFTLLTGELQLHSTRPIVNSKNIKNSLPKFFESLGYKTFFIFSQPFYMEGIDAIAHSLFMNQIDSKGLEKWASNNSFDIDRFDWGVEDHIISKYLKSEILDQKFPIFALIGFSNTHSPYYISKLNPDYGKKLTAKERYKSSIQETYKNIREIVNLIRLKRKREPLILIISDHGESFGENGFWRHNYSIYNQETHVPCEIINSQIAKLKYIPSAGLPDFSKSFQSLFSHTIDISNSKNIFSKEYKLDLPLKTWNVETYFGYILENEKFIYSKEANLLYKMDLLEQKKIILSSKQERERFFSKWNSYK